MSFHPQTREDHFIALLHLVNWEQVNVAFICDHVDRTPLYQMSADALLNLLHVVIDRQGIVLGPKYQSMYQSLQERLLPDQVEIH